KPGRGIADASLTRAVCGLTPPAAQKPRRSPRQSRSTSGQRTGAALERGGLLRRARYLDGVHRDTLLRAAHVLELHGAVDQRKQRVVLAEPDIPAGGQGHPDLAHDDAARVDLL